MLFADVESSYRIESNKWREVGSFLIISALCIDIFAQISVIERCGHTIVNTIVHSRIGLSDLTAMEYKRRQLRRS